MAGKTVDTQEGPVSLSAGDVPTAERPPVYETAYSSPYQERLEREAAEALANEAKDVFRGEDWAELPNFYCPLCSFASLDGDVAVLSHGAQRHPGADLRSFIKPKDEQPADGEEADNG